ncbi:MAG: NgoPII family restriction endonuclease [bacterium]|nr:NgoPII family restriction endonuclease [bacterium]
MKTNLLIAISNIIKDPNNNLAQVYRSTIRANAMGDALEFYVKDIFCGTLKEKKLAEEEAIYRKNFSYLGNQNNPPDIIIREGDAIEVKKFESTRPGGIALNSSYPKDALYSESPLISNACRRCENWSKKDIIYIVGGVVDGKIHSLWFVYGNCYAADRKVYEKIRNKIASGLNSLPDIEFGKTKELARINRVDPLGITDLRVRGMWGIKHPARVFGYIKGIATDLKFNVNAIMLREKYLSFPEKDRLTLERLDRKKILIKDIKIKSPNNPAKLLNAKLLRLI